MEAKSIKDLIPAAQQALAPVRKEIEQSKTIEQQRFELALKGVRVCKLPLEDLKDMMKYIYTLVGLRAHNWPQGLEKDFLHNYIYENYGGHTMAELKLAFDMAVQGKLEVDANHYENFSVAYFAKIMEAYRRWARSEYTLLSTANPPAQNYTEEEKKWIDRIYWFAVAWEKLNHLNKKPCRIRLKESRRAQSEKPSEKETSMEPKAPE